MQLLWNWSKVMLMYVYPPQICRYSRVASGLTRPLGTTLFLQQAHRDPRPIYWFAGDLVLRIHLALELVHSVRIQDSIPLLV